MELVKILRELWKHKVLLALVLAFSILVGFLLAFKPSLPPQSRQYEVAIATSDILVDTRDSQVVAVGRRGPDLPTLAGRANLMGNLMTSGAIKEGIAKRAGVSSEELVVVPPADPSTPGVAPVPVKPRGAIGVPEAELATLTLSTDDTLPILHVDAQAPSVAIARRLSSSTLAELRQYLASLAASQQIPPSRQLVVREFGAPAAGVATRGLPKRYALAVTILLILLGCAAIVGGGWLVRNWRAAAATETTGLVEPAEPAPVTPLPAPQPSDQVSRGSRMRR